MKDFGTWVTNNLLLEATMSDFVEVKVDFPEADFWLVRRGTDSAVGEPVKNYSKYHIGIKVINTEKLLPSYLFYWFQHLFDSGYFKSIAHGVTRLVNIKTSDIKKIQVNET